MLLIGTLDDLERPFRILFGGHHTNLNKDRPIHLAQKCGPETVISGY